MRASAATAVVVGIVACAAVGAARAGGLVIAGGSPRAIGRAGTGTVGGDGGGALLVNPAAMARRDTARIQLGITYIDDDVTWQGKPDAPVARNQAPSTLAPQGAVVASLGSWIIGAAVMTSAISDRAQREPGSLPPDGFGSAFDARYAGLAGSLRRDTATVGLARRVGETLAVGLALSASHIAASETRRIWAGFGGRDAIGAPDHDVELALSGDDWFVPGVVAGVLYAPVAEPIELGASIGWSQRARVAGTLDATGTAGGPRVQLAHPTAALAIAQPWSLRAGARYLGDRYTIELDGDLWLAPDPAATERWALSGVRVLDPSTVATDLEAVPSRISLRTSGAVRASADVELVGGFLWATAGYAYSPGGTTATRQSPSFGDLGGHTAALGIEAVTAGITVTLGVSRTWSVAQRVASELSLDNPFNAGDAHVPTGTYDGSIDQIGVLVDYELSAPR